jgi:hypothetical protein
VETDEFLAYFRLAATQVDMRPAPLWQRLLNGQRLLWGGSAVVAAGLMLLLPGVPDHLKPQPAIVQMQSLRGPEARTEVARGRPSLLIFDVPIVRGRTDFEIEIVDTAGNEILKGNGNVKGDHLTFPIRKLAPAAYWVRVYQRQPAKVLVAEYGLEAK